MTKPNVQDDQTHQLLMSNLLSDESPRGLELLMRVLMHAIALLTFYIVSCGSAARAEADADFYRGRTVSVVVGYEPGSGNDLLTRLVAKFMRERIPGQPTIVVR